jgi:flagellum-specific peptidoglycan hydrolase FlgJ
MPEQGFSFGPALNAPAGGAPRGIGGLYIPIQDIPNAPQAPEMPMAQYPQVPSIRYQPIEGKVNMSSEIRDLQQAPLPEGFAQGAALLANAAGKGQMAMGEAITKAGSAIGTGLDSVGKVMTRMVYEANKAQEVGLHAQRDAFWKQSMADNQQQWAEQGLTPAEQQEDFEKNRYPQMQEHLLGITKNQGQHDDMSSWLMGQKAGTYVAFKKDQTEFVVNSNIAALQQGANDAVKEGNYDLARQYTHELTAHQYITPQAGVKMNSDIDRNEQQSLGDQVVAGDWKLARDETAKILRGEQSETFPWMKNDRAEAQRVYGEAQQQGQRIENTWVNDTSDKILNGETLSNEQIIKEAKDLGLAPEDNNVKGLLAQNTKNPVYDSGKIATAGTMVAQYDPRKDVDEHGVMRTRDYDMIRNWVVENIPREQQKGFLDDLQKQLVDSRSGVMPTVQKELLSTQLGRLKELRDQGVLVDPLTKQPTGRAETGTGDKRQIDLAIQSRADYVWLQKQQELLDWAHDPKNAGFTSDELREKFSKVVKDATTTAASQEAKPGAIPGTGAPPRLPDWRYQTDTGGGTFQPTGKAPPAQIESRQPSRTDWNKTTNIQTAGVFEGGLKGKESTFVATANKYGLDPSLLMAISAHETGKGNSAMMREKNNPGGLYDSKKGEYMSFPTPEAGIDAMAKNLKEKYIDKGLTTIEAIQKEYAPVGAANDPRGQNKDWVRGVTDFQNQIRKGGGTQKVSAAGIDSASAKQIASLEPQVQRRAQNFMGLAKKWAAENGYEVKITEGYRSPERQNELYAQGRGAPGPIVTNARAGQSHHQSKKAFDVMITKNGKEVDKKEVWNQLAALGKQAGLAWGGDFKSIYDPNHFEYMGT